MSQHSFPACPAALSRRQLLAGAASLPALTMLSGKTVPADRFKTGTLFGVNFYSLFLRGLQPGKAPATYDLAALAHAGIPFVRFPASGQNSGDWSVLDNDPGRYWSNFDKIFATAENANIKLVPSIFWNPSRLPIYLDETMRSWLEPNSRTARYAQNYTETFCRRYDSSPALLMYEFGNELNSWIDLPNATEFWPKPDPNRPDRKPMADDVLSSAQFRHLLDQFASLLRKYSYKSIVSGNNIPRENGWHLAHHSWATDTRDQFIDILRTTNARDMDVLSIHLYPMHFGGPKTVFQSSNEVLAAMVEAARLDNRITFLGEFGVPRTPEPRDERRQFALMIDAIRSNGVDYAAVWNYAPFAMQPDFDLTFTNGRAYQLQAILAANKG